MTENIPPSDADIIDELASIVIRVSDLIQLATTGPYKSRGTNQIAKRLRGMERYEEAKELEKLIARAKELKSTSSESS